MRYFPLVSKKLIKRVRPGVLLVLTMLVLNKALIKLDLPVLLRPIKATSFRESLSQSLGTNADFKNFKVIKSPIIV